MKTFTLCVVIGSLCAGCVTRKPEALTDCKTSVYVPRKLSIVHTQNIFEVAFDNFYLCAPVNVTVDAGLTTAIAYDVYVHQAGQPRPASPDWHGRHRDLDFGFAPCVYYAADGEFPFVDGEFLLPGIQYVVEVDAAVIETEPGTLDDCNFGLPVCAMADDPRFKILWKGHLEQMVK